MRRKSFIIGVIIGILLFFILPVLLFTWIHYHPITDCDDACMNQHNTIVTTVKS